MKRESHNKTINPTGNKPGLILAQVIAPAGYFYRSE
jgi:hypothetical protein